jgi:hypothetical protein
VRTFVFSCLGVAAVAAATASFARDPAPPPAHQDATCLKCHALDPHGLTVDTGESLFKANRLSGGVGCEGCHGPAEKWLTTHYQAGWKLLPNEVKAKEFGFTPTKDIAYRVQACAACHVGAADREVNHDLIAAGHPRLAFEYTRFHYFPGYAKHWREPVPNPEFEVRAWFVGQVATLWAAVDLLRVRAERADSNPWPEFAAYSCYSCHQGINKEKDFRSDAGQPPRKRGSLPWEVWHTALIDVLPGQTPALFPGIPAPTVKAVRELKALMDDSPRPDPAKVRDTAAAAVRELDAWLTTLKPGDTGSPADLRGLITAAAADALTKDRQALRDYDWDFAAQHYLACAAAFHAAGGKAVLPEFDGPLDRLRGVLKFPAGYNSPRDYQPRDAAAAFGQILGADRAARRTSR